jgi:hypothetical protein
VAAALVLAVLLPSCEVVLAGGTYHSPPSTGASRRSSADNTRLTSYSLPLGAPVDRTYTWYAPPAGYKVVTEGTPQAPRMVTVVGPDGTVRSTRLEGPIVVRLRYHIVREASR